MNTIQAGLVTSQNVIAPKHTTSNGTRTIRLVTSQNVTAPKLGPIFGAAIDGLVTSQNVTAPKRKLPRFA